MKTLNDNPSNGNPVPTDNEFYDRGFNEKVEAEMFDNGPESRDEQIEDGAVKGVAWLGAIVGVFALAILIAAAFNLSPTPSAAKPHPVRTAMQKAFISSPDAASGVNESNYASYAAEPAIKPVVVKTITVVKQTGNAVKDASAKASDASASVKENVSSAAAMSKTDMDRIEKEALEVIHGDYGNNPGRAAKLGADYALVQARVNQLLHS